MCRSNADVGGPRRCSGDTRVNYERAAQELARLERRGEQFGPDFREARARAEAEERGWRAKAVDEAGRRARARAEAEAETAAAPSTGAQEPAEINTVLCKPCWQAAIRHERKTGVSRLRGYRSRHPNGAAKQCDGRTWW